MLYFIDQKLAQLSPAERRVAVWVLAHPRQAANATLASVAHAAGVSEPTVVRFCRRIGLGGFRELALRLVEALSRPGSFVHKDVNADDATPDAAAKVIDASIQALFDLRAALSSMPIERAATVMHAARQIAFAGLGASGHVAGDARHKFFRLGIPCTVLADSPGILQFASIVNGADVLVLISHRGNWPELALAAATARERGAQVIGLTNSTSPLAGQCSIVFDCKLPEDTSIYTPMNSRLAQLALLDAVHVSLALKLGNAASECLRQTKGALTGFLGGERCR